MNQKYVLIVASLAFAALTACGGGSGGTTGGSAAGSTGSTAAGTSTGGHGSSTAGGSTGGSHSSSSSSSSSTGSSASAGSTGSTATAGSTGSSASAGSTGGTATAGSTGGTTGGIPPVPTLGAEIDREGRPAVNTALTDPLGSSIIISQLPDAGSSAVGGGGANPEDEAKNQYNSTSNPNDWPLFDAQFIGSLAVYDALDGTCGNQLAFDFGVLPDAGLSPKAYGGLASALSDDELYVDTTQTTCQQYLAVEADFIYVANGAAAPFADCGGRTPNENVMDETYGLLANGMIPAAGTTINGFTANPSGQAHTDGGFPYLNAPL